MKDLNITVENGIKTLELRTGEAVALKPPIPVKVQGTIIAPLEWLKHRNNEIDPMDAHIIVNKENKTISLVFNETDAQQKSEIVGKLEMHHIFVNFGINSGQYKTPFEMAEFIKMHRGYFENRQYAMELVTKLREFKANVNKDVEASENPNTGDKRVLIAQVVDSNVPKSFNIEVPLFKGAKKQKIEVETYFNPSDMTCTLVSAGANELVQELTENVIDSAVRSIQELETGIVIIEE